jgi:hypothetical protein
MRRLVGPANWGHTHCKGSATNYAGFVPLFEACICRLWFHAGSTDAKRKPRRSA